MIKELSKYKDDLKNCLNDLKNVKTWYKQIPNLLTISRPLGMIPANILFFTGNVLPAIILTGCLLLTDLFDGKLARKWNVQSKLGADLDAVGDKIMFLGMALPIAVINPMIIINILLEGAIAGVNVMGRLQGLDTKTVYMGKIKTCFLSLLLLMGYVTHFINVPSIIWDIIMMTTCVTQGMTLGSYVNKYKKMKNEIQESNMSLGMKKEIEQEVTKDKVKDYTDTLEWDKDNLLGTTMIVDNRSQPKVRRRKR